MAPAPSKVSSEVGLARKVLKGTCYFGMSYMTAMCLAHFFSFKYPLLFVYWDTPFYAYQDKIISFCVATFALIFQYAANDLRAVSLARNALLCVVGGLTAVNLSADLQAVIPAKSNNMLWYWAQTGVFAATAAWVMYWESKAQISLL